MLGMQIFDDDDDLMHGVIITHKGLEYNEPMDYDYYAAKVAASWFNANLYTYCPGASGVEGFLDVNITLEWKSVFPVYSTCRVDAALPLLVRTRRRNREANERRAQRACLLCDTCCSPSPW